MWNFLRGKWACYSKVLGDVFFYSGDTHKCKNGVCVCVGRLFWHYRLRGDPLAIPAASELREPEIEKGDFPETTAFDSDKLARSRTALRGPTHQ